jgi:hypothetical protein
MDARQPVDEWKGEVTMGGKKICNLRYPGDTVLLASSYKELSILLGRAEMRTQAELQLNRQKNQILIVDRDSKLPPLGVPGKLCKIEVKEQIICSEALITNRENCTVKIKRRLATVRTAMANLTRIRWSREISEATKMRVFEHGYSQ